MLSENPHELIVIAQFRNLSSQYKQEVETWLRNLGGLLADDGEHVLEVPAPEGAHQITLNG